jgi:hypothetical protein
MNEAWFGDAPLVSGNYFDVLRSHRELKLKASS